MVTQINFGGFTTDANGKTTATDIGGIGLDTTSIINQLTTARGQQATNDQTQITANGKITSALNQFQSLLSAFQSAADALRNPPGVGNAADNVFDFTTAGVGNGGSSYLSVTAQPGAALQTYNISNISSLATAASQSTGIFKIASADATAVSANPISGTPYQFAPGTITFSDGQTITLNEGDSLNTVANDFNAISGTTGIAATVIQVASGQYELSFNATQTGAAGSFNLANNTTITGDPSGVLGNVGLTEQQSTGIFTISDPNQVVASTSNITGTTGTQFTPGTYSINGQNVTINNNDTLTQVAADFNSVAGTGITAHVVQVGTNQYELTFTQNPGAADLSTLNLATEFSGTGNGNVGSIVAATADTAGTDASFELNGITITRSTNSISDAVTGLTFNLLGKTSDGTTVYPVTISPDTTTIQNTINSFVSAYNALQTFAVQQTQLNSDGTYASTAVLATNQTFRQTMSDITQEVTAQVAGLSGSITSLAGVGITFTTQAATSTTPQVDNILTVNDQELTSALASNFQAVDNLFGFNMTSDNPNLTIFSETNALNATSFTLDAAPSTGTFTATLGDGTVVDLTATSLSSGGYTLTGPSGSALDGLQLIYASNNDATIDVSSITQGIADRIYNSSNAATTANTGTIAVALTGIQTQDTTLQNDITSVNAQVAQYKAQLTQQYAALESAVSGINSLLSSLAANDQARLVQAQIG